MLGHSSSMAVRSCWILAGTGTRCRIWRSRASQIYSMGDMSGEYAGQARTGMFSASRNCVQILATWGRALLCCNMRWWSWMNGTTMGLRILSRYHLPCPVKTRIHLWIEHLFKVSRRHWMWAFAHSSQLRQLTAVRSRPRWGRRACRWAYLRRFLTVCADILWLCKPIVAAAVRVTGLRWSWRWRCWMWRSWAGVVTCGLRLWDRLDVLPNSLKRLWRPIMVEKWTFNSRATALVDIPAVSMLIAHSLKTYVALCCVIKLHILEWPFIVASLRHTCAIIMLSNQHLDMPHLWGGWIISAKEKCSLTQICEQYLREIGLLCT